MKRISLAETAHSILEKHLAAGDSVIDATVGNGHDTLFLAQRVGAEGRVFGFDIQPRALANTLFRLQEQRLDGRVTLIQASHADMQQHLPTDLDGGTAAIMFNLGYLPGADKRITTQTATTLRALQAGCRLLVKQGVMTVMAYPGHPGGAEETLSLAHWCAQLEAGRFSVEIIDSQHPKPHSPRLFVLRKWG